MVNIYVTSINDEVKEKIEEDLNIKVIVRSEKWSINELLTHITDPNLKVIVVNEVDSQAIAEITLACLFCKDVLVTDKSIKEYPHIYDMIKECQPACNLNINNNSFISWYKHTKR